jgi:hypothetical protein
MVQRGADTKISQNLTLTFFFALLLYRHFNHNILGLGKVAGSLLFDVVGSLTSGNSLGLELPVHVPFSYNERPCSPPGQPGDAQFK